MEIIVRPRGSGKTAELIRRAAESQSYIVCASQEQATQIFHRARDMDLNIPFPLTSDEFFGGRFYRPGVRSFMFDNLDQLIRDRARGVSVLAATWTADAG